jgi:D-alanyl-D-alanine carboxypeptidase
MNKLSRELKLRKTSFANPHGLTNSLNFSNARDMMELTRYACSNKEFLKIAST